jgi:Ca-activated chloride channel homolog
MKRFGVAALLVVCGGWVAAEQPTFRTGVELVRIPVSVMRSGRPASDGLSASDFKLTEDGVAQSITLFERESLPVSLCIALDVSGSMSQGPADLAAAAIRSLTSELSESDELALITFAQTSQVLVPWSPPAAAARLSLTAEIMGSTSLNDATRAAFALIESAHNPRPVVLLITDGFDNSSRTRLQDVVRSRRQSEALVYAFTVAPDPAPTRVERFGYDPSSVGPGSTPVTTSRPDFSVNTVPELVGDSGGMSYLVTNAGDPPRIARRFIDELRYQYTLGYTPAKVFDGKYRRVKVEVNKRGYQIRHRGGYLALPSTKH